MKNLAASIVCLLGVFFAIASNTLAQTNNASLTGLVTDNSAAILPGVTVQAQNTETGIVTTVITNESGAYTFPSLKPGTYRLSGELSGFQTLVYSNVILQVAAQLRLNFSLQVASLSSLIEVSAAADSPLAEVSSNIGGVISNQQVRELPLQDHSVLGLLATNAAVVGDNFAGNRASSANLTMNGINVQTERFENGVSNGANFFNSIDLVDQVRIITSPADAELGRGTGQVQLTMRSGTNDFHGSVFEGLRNTALTANTYFNNLNGLPRPILIRNQFGGRIGGPIIKNKTFFFFLYEGQRQNSASPVTQTVLTAAARQGIFRYFPGFRNGNAISATPTVTAGGDPLPPAAGATLQSVNLYGLDPLRPGPDPTGTLKNLINATPLPNNFQVGDGLNTAGYAWNQRSFSNRDDIAFRIDHTFNQKNNLNLSYQHESSSSPYKAPAYPGSPTDATVTNSNHFVSLQFTNILSPTLVNVVTAGFQHPYALMLATSGSQQGQALLAVAPGGTKYIVTPTSFTSAMTAPQTTTKNSVPFYSLGDTISKTSGRHSYKAGVEFHWLISNSYNNTPNVVPQAVLGSGGSPVTGVASLNGIAANQTLAQNILTDLAGSLTSLTQTYIVPSSNNLNYVPGYSNLRTWQSREFEAFAKDDFKLNNRVTLNLGVRYEYYSVPWEQHGIATGLVGGSAGLFGISGTNFSALFRPGASAGSMTQPQPIGKNSLHANQQLFGDDYNNFAPAIGLSWSVPHLGHNETVFRMGYSVSYVHTAAFKTIDNLISLQAGGQTNVNYLPSNYANLSGVTLPLPPTVAPFAVVPFTDRQQNAGAFANDFRTPYVQNYNISLERELSSRSSIAIRLIGNKSTKLVNLFDINETNIFENGLLDAFKTTQAGGNAPLFDQMLNGLNLGNGVVNGTLTGSAALRTSTLTQAFFANNNVGGFANFLNTTTNFTGIAGGLLSRAGLPQNFIVVNPQYASASGSASGVGYACSCVNSSYNSLQLEYSKRFSGGFSLQSSYNLSKTLGTSDSGSSNFRTLRDRSLDKHNLSFDRTHAVKASGTYELPFGPGKLFMRQNGILGTIFGGWQLGGIWTASSGSPLNLASATTAFNQLTSGAATAASAVQSNLGSVAKVSNGVVYFQGLRQVADPSIANLTSQQSLNTKSTMLAVANAQGQPIFVNPTPGNLGNMAINFLRGPGYWDLDANLLKRVALTEKLQLEFRLDALNAANNAQFGNPVADINNINFGRITSVNSGSARVVVGNLRVTF